MSGKIFLLSLEVHGNALGTVLKDFKGEDWYKYPVTIEVPETDLGMMIAKLTEHKVKLVGVSDTGKVDDRKKGNGPFHYVGGKRDKGISGRDLILKLVGEVPLRVWKGDEISKEFVKNSFAGGSWGPPMSELVREKKITALGRGRYGAPGLTVKPGDLSD